MYRLIAFLWLCSTLAAAAQQKPVDVPETTKDFVASATHDWRYQLQTFSVTPAIPGGRSGKVWVRRAPEGLVIAGQVDGAPPDFPTNAASLMLKDHVEIWLAQQPNPALPIMGWGNQFGEIQLPKGENSCVEGPKDSQPQIGDVDICQQWAKVQNAYRLQLKRLFARQWQLSPQVSVESFASSAYRAIANESKTSGVSELAFLKPVGIPVLKAQPNPSGGYTFETLIPWSMFPPLDNVAFQDLYLMVEVFNSAAPGQKSGAYGSTAPGRGYAKFDAFNRIHFVRPKKFTISACSYPAVGAGFFDERENGYFLPTDDGMVSGTFILQNHFEGYAYSAKGNSPEVVTTSFFSKELGKGSFLCGPLARVSSAGKATDVEETTKNGPRQIFINKKSFDVLVQPDNSLLLREGPRVTGSKFGAGECGACPVTELKIFSVDQHMKAAPALDIHVLIGREFDDADIQISKDWNRVEVYRHAEEADAWKDEFYCRENNTYNQCRTGDKEPPKPRTLKPNEDR